MSFRAFVPGLKRLRFVPGVPGVLPEGLVPFAPFEGGANWPVCSHSQQPAEERHSASVAPLSGEVWKVAFAMIARSLEKSAQICSYAVLFVP
jgi:hypothetical protein